MAKISPPSDHVQFLVLERIDATRNMARYYVLSIEPTLFDEPAFVREWGRIGRSSNRRVKICDSHAAARIGLEAWLRKKINRGYAIRMAKAT